MITPTREYLEKLFLIQDRNIFRSVCLNVPESEPIYKVDLNKRTIAAPSHIGVSSDHEAEILYFQFPRYFDNMDLSKTTCVVQFVNANHEGGIYCVPYYDVQTLGEQTMIIPWAVSGLATAYSGTIQFTIRFFKVAEDDSHELLFNLTTQPTKTQVLQGMELDEEMEEKYHVDASIIAQVYATLQRFADSNAWDWIDIPANPLNNDEQAALDELGERIIKNL